MNTYFIPIRANIPHAKPKYGPGESKFKNDYYTNVFRKNESYKIKVGKIRSRRNVLFKTNKF